MFKRKRRRRAKAKKTLMQRVFRGLISIIILTAFILALSFFAGKVSSLDTQTALKFTEPLLEKLGISTDKVDEVGEVAGDFAERILETNIAPSQTYEEQQLKLLSGDNPDDKSGEDASFSSRETVFKVALLADSQNNNEKLAKALAAANSIGVHSVFFLGDYTDLGVLENLEAAKDVMDTSGVAYYSLPGDRDLYDTVGPQNFHSVFGVPQVSVSIAGTTFVIIDNSANYSLIGADKLGQYMQEIAAADFVLLAQPLYHPLASYGKPVMGLVQGETVKDVKEQALELLSAIQDSNTKAVFAADQHSFSRSPDEDRPSLEHIVVGPVTDSRADKGKTSITILSVYEDGGYGVEELVF